MNTFNKIIMGCLSFLGAFSSLKANGSLLEKGEQLNREEVLLVSSEENFGYLISLHGSTPDQALELLDLKSSEITVYTPRSQNLVSIPIIKNKFFKEDIEDLEGIFGENTIIRIVPVEEMLLSGQYDIFNPSK